MTMVAAAVYGRDSGGYSHLPQVHKANMMLLRWFRNRSATNQRSHTMSSTTSANMATARRKSGSRVVVGMVGAVQGRTGTERWVIRTRFICCRVRPSSTSSIVSTRPGGGGRTVKMVTVRRGECWRTSVQVATIRRSHSSALLCH